MNFAWMDLHAAANVSPGWFFVAAVVAMSTMVPKTAISTLCGTLYSTPVGCLMITLVATTAATLNYGIGRFVYAIPSTPGTRWHGVATTLRRGGWAMHFAVRLSPIPTMIISYLCGSLRCRVGPYLVAAVVASIPQWLWVAAAGAGVSAAAEGTWMRWTMALIAILAAVGVSAWIARSAATMVAVVE